MPPRSMPPVFQATKLFLRMTRSALKRAHRISHRAKRYVRRSFRLSIRAASRIFPAANRFFRRNALRIRRYAVCIFHREKKAAF